MPMTPDGPTILNQYIATEILKQPGRILSTEDKLISNGLVDSFHLVDLALFIEETFGVHIDDTELTADTFDTLAQLITLIEQRQ
jgi:acyl carrier protein